MGASGMPDISSPPLGFAIVTVTTTATTIQALLTAAAGSIAAIPPRAVTVMIQPRGGDVRFTDDGQNPVSGASGLGAEIFDSATFFYDGNLSSLRFIAGASTPCTLAFYG
jgi:hypothetical protein